MNMVCKYIYIDIYRDDIHISLHNISHPVEVFGSLHILMTITLATNREILHLHP